MHTLAMEWLCVLYKLLKASLPYRGSVKTSSFCSLICVFCGVSSFVFQFTDDASSPLQILSAIMLTSDCSTMEALLVELRHLHWTRPHCVGILTPLSSNWTSYGRHCVFGKRCGARNEVNGVMLEYVSFQPFIQPRNLTAFALSKTRRTVVKYTSFTATLRHEMERVNLAEFFCCIRFQSSELPVYYFKHYGEAQGHRIPDWADSEWHKGKQSTEGLAIGALLFLVLVCVNALATLVRFPELCLETEDTKVKPSILEDSTWNEIQTPENNLVRKALHKAPTFGSLNHIIPESELLSSTTIPSFCESKAFKDLSNFNLFESPCIRPGTNKRSRLEFDSLEFLEPIGSGYFKTVCRGSWGGLDVAIARMKKGGPLQEARILQSIPPHPNITKFHNWTTDHEGTEYVVMELMSMGELSTVLRKQSRRLSCSQKLEICIQICQAMQHLSSHNILHRDLAARNVLVKSLSPLIVKIADFGFAKVAGEATSPDVNPRTSSSCLQLVPLRWTSPEIIHSHSWSEKSEVWAFGVTMWEIFSNGHEPFAADFSSDFEVADYVLHGGHLSKPQSCPHFIYDVMCQCWKYDPSARPSFDDLTQQFLNFQSRYDFVDQEAEIKAPIENIIESSRSKLRSYAPIEEVF